MAKREIKEEVMIMRKNGMSYSQIRSKVTVSKSTLSLWLKDFPLSQKQMVALRDKNPVRIENYRRTMNKKREIKIAVHYDIAKSLIKKLSKRDRFIAGIFLYFGEGSKTTKATTAITNTNPALLKFFIEWLEEQNVERKNIKVKLTLYENMNIENEILFWCKRLKVARNQIRGPYIKKNSRITFTDKGNHGHGTATVLFENVDMFNTVTMYMKYTETLLLQDFVHPPGLEPGASCV